MRSLSRHLSPGADDIYDRAPDWTLKIGAERMHIPAEVGRTGGAALGAPGSMTGSWEPRPEACPNIRGGITIERDLPANTKLWLMGWTKTIAGGDFVSLLVEIADKGGRPRQ